AEERADEEDPPLVVNQVSEPTPPECPVLRRVAERNARGPDLFLLPTDEPRDEADATAHPIAFVPVVVDEHEVQARGEGGEARQRTEIRRARARRRGRGDHQGREGVPPDRGGDHEDRDDDAGQQDERDDGSFTGGEGETPDFDVVEDLEDRGHEDDPPDADEAGRGPTHRTRTDQPLAAPDGYAERDHARTEDVQEQLFRVDPALDFEDLVWLRQDGQRQRRA